MKLIFLICLPAVAFASSAFFQPPKPTVDTLPSGTTLFLLEDHEFPTVELLLYLKGGSVLDPKGKEGLLALTLDAMRYGGTSRKAQEIEEELERLGVDLNVGTNEEYGYFSLRVLKKNLSRALEILFELLRHPAFNEEQVKVLKDQVVETLLREEEDPLALVLQQFQRVVYGDASPWGGYPTVRSLQKIRREDLINFYERTIAPDRMVVASSGDFTILEMIREIKIQTAGWQSGKSLPEIPAVQHNFKEERWFLPRPGLTQSTIMVGHLGAKRDNPDKYPLLVMNYILGGGSSLTSRLGETIRTQEGKAYSVWSHFGFGKEEGIFSAGAQTAVPQTVAVTKRMLEMIGQMAKEPRLTESEVERAKSAILRSLFFDYETSQALVRDLAKFYLWGYPENYLAEFQRKISSLTREDVERVVSYLHPEGLKILIIGNDQIRKELKSIGKFKRLKL